MAPRLCRSRLFDSGGAVKMGDHVQDRFGGFETPGYISQHLDWLEFLAPVARAEVCDHGERETGQRLRGAGYGTRNSAPKCPEPYRSLIAASLRSYFTNALKPAT